MLAAVLIVNLGLQSAIQPFAFGATMNVSPLGVFLFTLLGGLVAGVLGAMMAAPILALLNRFGTDVRLPVTPPSEGDVAVPPPDVG
jgi:predicted PurR-regulated permease PerM